MNNHKSPQEPLLEAPFSTSLSAIEQERILYAFNQTEWITPGAETLITKFEKQVQFYPHNLAVRFRDQQLSYQQLDEQSNRLAHYLIAKGVTPGMLVPVWLDRSVEWLIAIVAILKAGAAYVPIDPKYPVKRVSFILEDTRAILLITDQQAAGLLKGHTDIAICLADQEETCAGQKQNHPGVYAGINDLAYVIYTSGSTGSPKGVMVKHHSIQHLVSWHNQKFEVQSNSALTLVAGLAFDISVWETWSALSSGATLYIADHEDRSDAIALAGFIHRNNITHAFVPPVLVSGCINHTQTFKDLQLKFLFTGGEQLKPVSTEALSYTLVDYYGPTECTVYATYRIVKEKEGHFVSSIGTPIANTRAYILGPSLEILPIGATGDLYIAGTALASGYLDNPDLTAQKFIPDPFQPGERMYQTGDLARWLPDGEIQFLGRKDNQVKIRGFRVELGEIEHVLGRVPGIKNAVVITKDNSGQNKYLVAFVVEAAGQEIPGVAALRQQLKNELPGYMVPAQIISINEIPLTANGKTDTARLLQIAENNVQGTLISEPPTNAQEQVIADIWSDVLERPVINISDNFFDIGGDSLMVAIVSTDMSHKLNVKVYIRDIYQNPVLKDLAALLKTRRIENEIQLPEEDMEPYVALERDVYLAPGTIFAGGFDPETLQNPTAVFLTGTTGFVGIHLLQELLDTTAADVYCLVRAQDRFHGMEKIDDCYRQFHITAHDDQRHRIKPVIGDLSKPYLGLDPDLFDLLSKKTDIIYHSGSSVNFIEPYSYMKAPNVDGLREIIRLAGAGRTKCLALLSTISVYSWGHVFTNKTVMLESDDIAQNLLAVSKDIGYVRSKWVMEAIADLAAKEGLPLITYRLGYAMCHSQTGASAPYQWWSGLVKNCIEFQSYPQLRELREGLITVDYMTKAIAHITREPKAVGLKFNLIARPETNLTLEQFFALLNKYYPLQLNGLPYKIWRAQWEDNNRNRLFPLTSLFKDNMHEGLSTVELYQDTYIWDCNNVERFLEGSGIEEPVFDKQILDAYLNYLQIPV